MTTIAKSSQSKVSTLLVVAAAFIIIVAGMKSAQTIIVPFLLSLFLAVVTAPSFFWLTKKKISESLAIIIIMFVVITVTVVLGALIGTSINDFVHSLPEYQSRLKDMTAGMLTWLNEKGVKLPEQELVDYFNPGVAMQLAANMFTEFSGVLGNAFLIVLAVIFMLLEASHFHMKLNSAFGSNSKAAEGINLFTSSLKQYMAIKTWISIATGIVVSVLLTIIGVDYPLLWGTLAFLLNYVPNIGSIIAAVPPVLLSLVQLGYGPTVLVILVYVFVNIVIGNIIEPRFMGSELGLSTFVVFFSLVFWGWVLGPVGMLLSVPLTMTIKIALESSEETRWIGVLLA